MPSWVAGVLPGPAPPGTDPDDQFYLVDEAFYLVDLPGYGFANVPKRVREAWGPMIEGYLLGRRELVGIIMLVDARHPPNRNDVQMADWLHHHGLAFGVVATKVDKVSRTVAEPTARVGDGLANGRGARFFSQDGPWERRSASAHPGIPKGVRALNFSPVAGILLIARKSYGGSLTEGIGIIGGAV